MEKQKKSVGTIALVVLLLIVTVAALVLATYAWAKYTTTNSYNSASANVARWNVSFSESGEFTGTYNHVTTGNIAPGTNGNFQVVVTPGNTDVCFNYVISVDSIQFLDGSSAPLATSTAIGSYTIADLIPHIKVYYMAGGTTKTYITPGEGPNVTGYYDATAATPGFTGQNTIYWEWDYESAAANYDAIDTAAGEYANANGLKMRINYTVTATQVNPTANHGTAN